MVYGKHCLSLDEVLELIREGQSPKDVAEQIGITERSLAMRFESADRLEEYKMAKSTFKAVSTSSVDVGKLMALADSGETLMRACCVLHYPRSVVIKRLNDDNRHIEYYVRYISAENHIDVPKVDSEGYFMGPREILVGLVPALPEDLQETLSGCIDQIDEYVKNGATLSRMCRGDRP
ncbi:MAG: hypothetical protein IJV47_06240 [Candidatus Methanomethylophilaceae archaeon]|nr:hypothetical protein [Candidatus Methanomethylophilaceae archaeon]